MVGHSVAYWAVLMDESMVVQWVAMKVDERVEVKVVVRVVV